MANSKITKAEKTHLVKMKLCNPMVTFHTNEETTVAFIDNPACNTIEFALSVASPDEQKFRRKVGKYLAMVRFRDGQTVKMARADFFVMMDCCYDFFLSNRGLPLLTKSWLQISDPPGF